MEKLIIGDLKETIFKETLDSGLKVTFIDKPGLIKKGAAIKVNFGSLDRKFKVDSKIKEYPTGVAHFLEHKMFEKKEDLDMVFSKLGASNNAYTDALSTVFHFFSNSNFYECLDKLFYLVFTKEFTKEGVDDEKDIIIEEINMYLDHKPSIIVNGILNNLYGDDFLGVDGIGTRDDIENITLDMLNECYEYFYHPSNMELFIIGDFNAQDLMNKVNEISNSYTYNEPKKVTKIYPKYDLTPIRKSSSKIYTLDGSAIGFKLPPITKKARFINYLVFLELYLGDSSKNFEMLKEKGLVKVNLDLNLCYTDKYFYSFIEFESDNPKKTREVLADLLTNKEKIIIDEELFNSYKNYRIGKAIYDSSLIYDTLMLYLNYDNRGLNYFETIEYFKKLKYSDFMKNIPNITKEQIASFYLKKEKEE